MHADPELTEPRDDEGLPGAALAAYLREQLPDLRGEMHVRQFGGGHANLTYLLSFDGAEVVLRRPPLGPIAPSSHDMQREHRVLSKLHQGFPLAPRSHLYCADPSVIGAPFQIMDRRHGFVVRERIPERHAGNPELNRRMSEMVVDVLASFHQVDRTAVGLADLGHPEGFVERQLAGWSKRWAAAAPDPPAGMAALLNWLETNLPRSAATSLLHNDYKLDNILVSTSDPATAVAVLDWDMCTSGDPLMDLGYLLNQWCETGDPPAWREAAAMPSDADGFISREQAVQRYATRTGFEVGDVKWYFAFSAMKFAVIIQQIYIRYLRGQTQDRRFAEYDRRVAVFVDKGRQIARA